MRASTWRRRASDACLHANVYRRGPAPIANAQPLIAPRHRSLRPIPHHDIHTFRKFSGAGFDRSESRSPPTFEVAQSMWSAHTPRSLLRSGFAMQSGAPGQQRTSFEAFLSQQQPFQLVCGSSDSVSAQITVFTRLVSACPCGCHLTLLAVHCAHHNEHSSYVCVQVNAITALVARYPALEVEIYDFVAQVCSCHAVVQRGNYIVREFIVLTTSNLRCFPRRIRPSASCMFRISTIVHRPTRFTVHSLLTAASSKVCCLVAHDLRPCVLVVPVLLTCVWPP